MADHGRVASQPGSQGYAPQPATPSSPVGADPSRDDSLLRSKARAVAESVWIEHRGFALPWNGLSFESSELLVDCCLKGMCIGMVAGSDLIRRDSDGSGEAGETHRGSTEGDSAGPKDIAKPEQSA